MIDRSGLLERIAAWGSAFTPETIAGTQELYKPFVPRPDEALVTRDLPYGDDERHRLDIFHPKAAAGQAPVLLFVHGGGFVMGDKGRPGEPYYNNVGAWAAGQGMLAATMTYRLAPAHGWPAGGQDVIKAVEWLAGNVAGHAGDPGRIFILGQSAGATHVADAVAAGGGQVAGALMISGIYSPECSDRNDFHRAYYGADEGQWAACSTAGRLAESGVRCFYSISEYDPPDFQRQAASLVNAYVAKRECWPEMHWLGGHNHLSSVCQLGTPDDTLGPKIADFIQRDS
jgi:triacylglycerol lipase